MILACSIRLVQQSATGRFQLETASQRLRLYDSSTRTQFHVCLVSTVHLADARYYAEIQQECESFDRVLFELITDKSLTEVLGRTCRINKPVRASDEQRRIASIYQLVPQADVMDCTRPHWVLADVSREELVQHERSLGQGCLRQSISTALRTLSRGPALRASSALRPLAWVLPAPELSLLLDDWTSSGGAPPGTVLRAIAVAAATIDLQAARRLSFAQTLSTGEATQQGSLAASLVAWRNKRAVDAVYEAAIVEDCKEIALLYGALHMRGDICRISTLEAGVGVRH